ncbi:COP9 signalosome complex subunit 2 [Yarrowia sp. B02]|nr:COP9 signalosome complex subunit 2 [Yarrowia sp. B02]
MSDDDEFMLSAGDEDYDFEYEDEEEEMEDDDNEAMDCENKYYNAKAVKEDEPEEAIEQFQEIIEDPAAGEWAFKSIKQTIKCLTGSDAKTAAEREKKWTTTFEYYGKMLDLITSKTTSITRNYAEKSLNSMVANITKSAESEGSESSAKQLEKVHTMAIERLDANGSDGLWLKTKLKLAKLYIDVEDLTRAKTEIWELREKLDQPDTAQDASDNYMLELLSLQIQYYTLIGNTRELGVIYQQTLDIKSACLPHPRILGVIRECGGKMYMREKRWDKACEEFFQSFKNYDEAGSPAKIQILKYLVVASILSNSDINVFDSQELQPYRSDGRISQMMALHDGFYQSDISDFYRKIFLQKTDQDLLKDKFLKQYFDQIVDTVQRKYVAHIIKPFCALDISFLARKTSIDEEECRKLLVNLIVESNEGGNESLSNARFNKLTGHVILDSSVPHLEVPTLSQAQDLITCEASSTTGQLTQILYGGGAGGMIDSSSATVVEGHRVGGPHDVPLYCGGGHSMLEKEETEKFDMDIPLLYPVKPAKTFRNMSALEQVWNPVGPIKSKQMATFGQADLDEDDLDKPDMPYSRDEVLKIWTDRVVRVVDEVTNL